MAAADATGDASKNMERMRMVRTYPNVPIAVNRPRTRQTTVSAYQKNEEKMKAAGFVDGKFLKKIE